MSSAQSPVRTRKPQILPTAPGPMQNNITPREASPSPSFRERQRTIKTHSMPIVPSVSQVLSGTNSQQNISQPSPTGSNGSLPPRRSPPATSRISPVTAKLASMSVNVRGDRTPERIGSPPPLMHSQSTPIVPQHSGSGTSPPVAAHQPRPIPRTVHPQFLSQFQMDEKWHVTDELLAEIDRADQQQGQLQGTSGVAYAGGAASNSNLHLLAKDPNVERVRASDRSSPKELDNGPKRQVREKEREANARESPKTRERSQTSSSISSQHLDSQTHAQRTPEYRGSPPFHTPMASPGERSAYFPDSYVASQGSAQQSTRKPASVTSPESGPRATPPTGTKLTGQTQQAQTVNMRVADRALPLQEEVEEDVGHDFTEHEQDYDGRLRSSPASSSELYPEKRYDGRRDHGPNVQPTDDEDEDTLNEEAHDHMQPNKSDDEDSGFTPRSPSTNLPERPRDERYSPTNGLYAPQAAQFSQQMNEQNQKTVRVKHHRTGSTDQLGIRSFDPTIFDSLRRSDHDSSTTVPRQTKPAHASPTIAHQQYPQTQSLPPPQQPAQPQQPSLRPITKPADPPYKPNGMTPLSPHYEDLAGVFDNPTSSYLQTFLQSPPPDGRNAPIPPTPLSHTAAPSPSPLSAMPSDIEPRQIGSPYPYPFAHIRRTALSAAQNAATSTFDPNDVAHVREQMHMQMQIYALNNGLTPPSESAFSPSSTPFPGVGYNPWGFLHSVPRHLDSTMSMRSSPSHEPINLPLPAFRAPRAIRRKEVSSGLRMVTRRKVKPPPRVESTQPRDTSPEPSSGEETAGETHFTEQYVPSQTQAQNGEWQNGNGHIDVEQASDDGESDWIDDDDETDDIISLEYHPSYITNSTKRRRKWETKWDALSDAFKSIDRETDATIVVLAAPSHNNKFYALTSRSIRRDQDVMRSPSLAQIRGSFGHIATRRRATRSPNVSLVEQLSSQSGSVDGSSRGGGEENLRRALDAALGSLGALSSLYDQREARWRDEMRRLGEDRARVELLIRQVLGPSTSTADRVQEEPQLLG